MIPHRKLTPQGMGLWIECRMTVGSEELDNQVILAFSARAAGIDSYIFCSNTLAVWRCNKADAATAGERDLDY